jgi:3-methyladenine DNA glycosylase/8-oxoguanine DNA glycosylase
VVEGTYRATIVVDGRLERVHAAQRSDGSIHVAGDSDAGVDHVRFALALDDDHSEFLRRFSADPLIGLATQRLKGLRPMRAGTVTQSLLRAVAGQLIQASHAREIERRVIRASTTELGGLHAPPTPSDLGRYSPPQLRALGLGARRATTLIRLCRTLDLERLRQLPTAAAAARLAREPGLGPWSVGVVCVYGLGRYDCGLRRDLGLIRLASALRGRWVEAAESDELLEPYGEWAGLASIYLLAGFGAGYIPLPRAGLAA